MSISKLPALVPFLLVLLAACGSTESNDGVAPATSAGGAAGASGAAAGTSGAAGGTGGSTAGAGGSSAGQGGAAGDTWQSFAEGFAATYCVECHATGNAKRDYTTMADVKRDASEIACGVATTKLTGCATFPPPRQFPIPNATKSNPKPDDATRDRFVAWIQAGLPELVIGECRVSYSASDAGQDPAAHFDDGYLLRHDASRAVGGVRARARRRLHRARLRAGASGGTGFAGRAMVAQADETTYSGVSRAASNITDFGGAPINHAD